jgi:hypothetical protein
MFYTKYNLYLLIFVLIIILAASITTFSTYSFSSSPSTYVRGSTPYGVPYEDWIPKWWQWNIQIPKEQHPVTKGPSLIQCPTGESGSVTFLSQSLQGESQYSCTIPAGNAILIPISTGECTTEEARSSVPAELIKCATEGDKFLTFDATVDGIPLNGLDQNYAISKIFNLTVPEDNFLDLKSGQWKAGAGGNFVFLKPLATGDHLISIAARVTNPIDPSYNYNYHTRFLLKVQ